MARLHPISAVTTALHRGVVGFSTPFFLVSVLSGVFDPVSVTWIAVLSPLGFLVGAAWGVAYYYRFEYELTRDTFDLSSGVLSRRTREIPFGRIQNVDVSQGVFHQLVGVAVLGIETAGGGDTEATLRVVDEAEADRLQREIRRLTADAAADQRRESDGPSTGADSEPAEPAEADEPGAAPGGEPSGPGPADAPTLLFDLSARELLLYSFTSFRVAAAAGVVFLAFLLTEGILEFLVAAARPLGGPASVDAASLTEYGVLGIVSLLHGIVVTYLLGAIYTFASYYDFKLGRAGDDLVYSRGLLQRYSGSIPFEKVQSVTITSNPLQRAISYGGLWVETAGYGPDSASGSQSAVPLAHADRVYWFTERLTGVEEPAFRRPPALARRRYLVRYSIVAGVFVGICAGLSIVTALDRWWLAFLVFLAVPPAAHLRWANLGYFVGENHLIVRAGFWRRRTTVIPYYRVQTVSTRRSIFQRRLDLASLVVDTASSRTFFGAAPTIHDVDLAVAREVHAGTRDRLQLALAARSDADGGGPPVATP